MRAEREDSGFGSHCEYGEGGFSSQRRKKSYMSRFERDLTVTTQRVREKTARPFFSCNKNGGIAFLHLLRLEWTKDGQWMDTLEEEKVWDEDEYYAHLDNLDFDFD